MRIVTFSEARNNLKSVLDQLVSDASHTIISRRDTDDAVLMSLNYFTSLMETASLLRVPANRAHLAKSIERYQRGDTAQHGLIDD